MTYMSNQFEDYVKQRAYRATGSTYSNSVFTGSPYTVTLDVIKETAKIEIEKEEEEVKKSISDIHIFDPEDLFL